MRQARSRHDARRTWQSGRPPESPAATAIAQPDTWQTLQQSIGNAALGRMLAAQRQAGREDVMPVAAATQHRIESLKGEGGALPGSLRSLSELALGSDLSAVRLHDDARAAGLAESVDARAFTQGNDVFLGADVATGRRDYGATLAHELTHVARGLAVAGGVQRIGKDEDELMPMDRGPEVMLHPSDEEVANADALSRPAPDPVKSVPGAEELIAPAAEESKDSEPAAMQFGEKVGDVESLAAQDERDGADTPSAVSFESKPSSADLMKPGEDDTRDVEWGLDVSARFDEVLYLSQESSPDFAKISSELIAISGTIKALDFGGSEALAQTRFNLIEMLDMLVAVCTQYTGQEIPRQVLDTELLLIEQAAIDSEQDAPGTRGAEWSAKVLPPLAEAVALCRQGKPDWAKAEQKFKEMQLATEPFITGPDAGGPVLERRGLHDKVQTVRMILYRYMNAKATLGGFRSLMLDVWRAMPNAEK